MEADIRLIRLLRKAVAEKQDESEVSDSRQSYFATDYFDILQADEKTLQNSFAEILDIRRENFCRHETAAQSYALYSSARMLEEYESNQKREYRKNPFLEHDDLKYFSIIHIYLTPEIIARMDYHTDDMWNDTEGIIMKPFADDIYQVLDMFQADHPGEMFAARLYVMLSAGDFAVAVRSRKPEISYYISTYFRKRKAGKKGAEKQSAGYVLYKTYTLLTIENQVVYSEGDRKGSENHFILRGCYSNKFWKEQEQAEQFRQSIHADSLAFYPMSGRYDFTASLTEKEFFALMPQIAGNGKTGKEGGENDAKRSEMVCYISYLMEKQYLSYVNERYLVGEQDRQLNWEQESVSPFVVLDKKGMRMRDLYERNEEKINRLLVLHREAEIQIQNIGGYRKQLRQSLFFLKRQILLCRSINELSDARIYARVLAEQLKAVLKSAAAYAAMEEIKRGNSEMLDCLEKYLQKSVWTLDSYAQYVRNNNLQSLQAPNYNIETAMGMEKVLIGYSELLWKFMDYYQKEVLMPPGKSYLPIMVPDLHNREVSVEVLFPEKKDLYQKDRHKGSRGEKETYVMVVGSPSMEEISEISVMIASLFHEAAHQFRYESREIRNNAVLESIVREVMEHISKGMTEAVNIEIGVSSDASGSFRRGMTAALTNAFLKSKYRDAAKIKDASLEEFIDMLNEDINGLFTDLLHESKLELRIREFISEVHNGIVFEGEYFERELGCLQHLIEESDGKDSNEIISSAFRLAWLCAYRSLSQEERKPKVKETWESSGDAVIWKTEWQKNFGGIQNQNIKRIWKAFYYFELWICDDCMDWMQDNWSNGVHRKETGVFKKVLYQSLREHWYKEMHISGGIHCLDDTEGTGYQEEEYLMAPEYHYWTLAGRYLGLDYEMENGKKFYNAVKKLMKQSIRSYNPSFIRWYREETADLLMCNVIPMEPAGYMNLVAVQIIQNKHHVEMDVKRIFCILYVHWCYIEGRKEESWERYKKLCCGIFQNARERFLSALKLLEDRTGCHIMELVQSEAAAYLEQKQLAWENNKAETIQKCRDRIIFEKDYIAHFMDILRIEIESTHLNSAIGEAENVIRIYDILIPLVCNGVIYWMEWNDNEKVLRDLAYGDKVLRGLREKMTVSSDKSISMLARTGGCIAGAISQSYSQKGDGNKKELNRMGIELLLRMYYNNKIRKAQDRGESGEN